MAEVKFLLYGSHGWIGQMIVQLLKDGQFVFHQSRERVDNIEAIKAEIQQIKPTHLICCMGRTNGVIDGKVYPTIDYLEQPGKLQENIRDNLFSPVVLAILAAQYDLHLTYLGTGCIFTYDETHPYGQEVNGFTETAAPNFMGSSYSTVKGFTDRLMPLFRNNVLNVRIRMPISAGKNSRNFITKITNYAKICSIPNSMTVLPELLPIMIDMSINKMTGTINLVNPGLISHNEILSIYRELVDPQFTWNNFTIEEQNAILAAQRSNNYLDTTLLQSKYPDVRNIKDAIRYILTTYA